MWVSMLQVPSTVTPSPTPTPEPTTTVTETVTASPSPGPELASAEQFDSLLILVQTLGTVVAVGLAICILLLAYRALAAEQ